MSYRLVKGDFHLFYQGKVHVGAQPDGDSIWFKPQSSKALSPIGGRNAKANKGGMIQLRVEAIDALELHFLGLQQNDALAKAARDFTLKWLGFKSVTYTPAGKEVSNASPHPIPGYILTRAMDPYGRPVSFVFRGSTNSKDGSETFLDVPLLGRTLNAALAASGQAYPTFYTGLPTDLRVRFRPSPQAPERPSVDSGPLTRARRGQPRARRPRLRPQ